MFRGCMDTEYHTCTDTLQVTKRKDFDTGVHLYPSSVLCTRE